MSYLYETPWYIFEKNTMKSLNIMQTNLMRPQKLTAGKLMILNLPTFLTVIIKFVYYIFINSMDNL